MLKFYLHEIRDLSFISNSCKKGKCSCENIKISYSYISKLVSKTYTVLTKRIILSLKTILCENAIANDQKNK